MRRPIWHSWFITQHYCITTQRRTDAKEMSITTTEAFKKWLNWCLLGAKSYMYVAHCDPKKNPVSCFSESLSLAGHNAVKSYWIDLGASHWRCAVSLSSCASELLTCQRCNQKTVITTDKLQWCCSSLLQSYTMSFSTAASESSAVIH